MPKLPKVLLLITDAGGGHRASAEALKAACELHGAPLDVRVVNVYREVWQKAEPLGRLTGVYGEDVYNFTLRHSLLGIAAHLRTVARLAAGMPNPTALKDAVAYLRRERPALCVSLMPFVNDMHARACAEAGVPLALVMTDWVDVKPYMWYTPGVCSRAAWVAAPGPEAAAQAREAGAERVLECGLLLHPKYHDASLRATDRRSLRRELGLDENLPTVLLSMGGYGGSSMEDLVAGLRGHPAPLQIVVACGRNTALAERLRAMPAGRHRLVALGFTKELHRILRAADLMVGKPGPASMLEAVATATPLILDAASAMPQEAPNAALAQERGWAVSVPRRRDLPQAVARLLADPQARAALEARQRATRLPDTPGLLVRALLESASVQNRKPETAWGGRRPARASLEGSVLGH